MARTHDLVLKPQEKRARVHFIPDLKVGVFVTHRAPEVIKSKASGRYNPEGGPKNVYSSEMLIIRKSSNIDN